MDLDLNLEADAAQQRYWDLLVLYLLVGSTLGDCDLYRRIGRALDDGGDARVTAELSYFERLPDDLKCLVREGDPTLEALNGIHWDLDEDDSSEHHPVSA